MKIVLIGYSGVGKTTLGQQLAQKIGVEFIDTDQWIVEKAQCSIAEIFETKGEAYFRTLETEALKQCLKHKACVIATGGGIVELTENQDILKKQSCVIYLKTYKAALIAHIDKFKDRPLYQSKSWEALFDRRVEIYPTLAHYTIDVSNDFEITLEKIYTQLSLTSIALKSRDNH